MACVGWSAEVVLTDVFSGRPAYIFLARDLSAASLAVEAVLVPAHHESVWLLLVAAVLI